MCTLEKGCYPKVRVWLIQILPGTVSALTGLALYSFLETEENYYYTHSIWHILMATAILFLLPRDGSLELKKVKAWLCKIRVPGKRRNEVSDEMESVDESNRANLIESSSGSDTATTVETDVSPRD